MKNLLKALISNGVIIAAGVSIVYFFGSTNPTPSPSSTQQPSLKPVIGQKAPDFSGITYTDERIKLSDYLGKIVVLEWKNHLCPFVKKHYNSNNMQQLQQSLTQKGVVWISIISSAEGKQGHMTKSECEKQIQKENSFATTVILDESGDIGRLYNAKTTPHMFVINQQGTLAYMGAIDSIRSTRVADVNKATNYVVEAVTAIENNTTPTTTSTPAYGCSIKY